MLIVVYAILIGASWVMYLWGAIRIGHYLLTDGNTEWKVLLMCLFWPFLLIVPHEDLPSVFRFLGFRYPQRLPEW